MAFEDAVPPKAQLERLISVSDNVQRERALRAGFFFQPGDYAPLKDLKNEGDSTGCVALKCVRRFLVYGGGGINLEIAISVHSGSVQAARTEFIGYILRSTMKPPEAYAPGPPGYGDFCVLLAHEADADKVKRLIHFMRANIGVTIELTQGQFNVAELARQIDAKIAATDSAMDISPSCPQEIRGALSKKRIHVGETLEFMVDFDRKDEEDYGMSVRTDTSLLKRELFRERKTFWLARAPGIAPIQATVWNSRLLSSTMETSVTIVEAERR